MSGDKKDEILAKKHEYQHSAKLGVATKSKKFLASMVNMSENDLDQQNPYEDGHDFYEVDEARMLNIKDFQYEFSIEPATRLNDHDPYNFVYVGLPETHHVLKKVHNCFYYCAKRFEGEGPVFCCWNERVNIFILEVPDELRRLFTSQTDRDAKYFRRNIRYLNSHFSFTSMGVSIDCSLATAKGTVIYTFKAHGQIYHMLDQLMLGAKGPCHMQLYFYDTDETMHHRMKRSPHLDANVIRTVLNIMQHNPYV
ncbi:unnamed protein product [Miscanthus lutarioriparius]|uniref:Helitron helicase-like domain-containing protein n=1 Tax=Miscanthus lutarioriparius TaxID=422564 RepID=A0A811Q7P2_9POAL|nr:unnamed protein product [Miscanthus lutarioriparius]